MAISEVQVKMFGEYTTLSDTVEHLLHPFDQVERRVTVYKAVMSQTGQLVNCGMFVKLSNNTVS